MVEADEVFADVLGLGEIGVMGSDAERAVIGGPHDAQAGIPRTEGAAGCTREHHGGAERGLSWHA